MMTPLRWVTGGGDHEKVTCLSPMTVSNISGAPDGAEYNIIIDLPHRMFYILDVIYLLVISPKKPH